MEETESDKPKTSLGKASLVMSSATGAGTFLMWMFLFPFSNFGAGLLMTVCAVLCLLSILLGIAGLFQKERRAAVLGIIIGLAVSGLLFSSLG